MDHTPGPIIATVAPRPASRMAISEFPDHANDIQTSTDGNRNSRDWRPEPKKEKYARDSRNQIREAGRQSSVSRRCEAPQ